ncbi:hypothetical protein ACPWSP_18465 [Pandoraea pneumonica]
MADIEIAKALIVHLSNTPQDTDVKSTRVTTLCALLAHGLGFVLADKYAASIHLDKHPHTLIQHDDSFAWLHALLVPDWKHDTPGDPTFSVHPVDPQLFDSNESTDDLVAYQSPDASPQQTTEERKTAIRDWRRRLTDRDALTRVRSRIVKLIANSVRDDCAHKPIDWRVKTKLALIYARTHGITCGDMLARLGEAVMRDISVYGTWQASDDRPRDEAASRPPSMPMNAAQWLVRVLAAERDAPGTPASECQSGLMALARMDTPASVVVGSPSWANLVKGVEVMGERHWYASFDTVRLAGETGHIPPAEGAGGEDDNPPDPPGGGRKKPSRPSKSRHRRGQPNWRHR